jgi:HSP20 family protein
MNLKEIIKTKKGELMSILKKNNGGLKTTRNYGNDMLPVFSNLIERLFDTELMPSMRSDMNLPAVNINETKDEFKIEVAAPGLKKEDFKINLDNNVLTISSEKEESKEENDENIRRREFSYSSFMRSFQLPEQEVDSEKIQAKYENGILKIELPKKEEAKKRKEPKKIAIV